MSEATLTADIASEPPVPAPQSLPSVSRANPAFLVAAALLGAGLAWPLLMHFEKAFPVPNLPVEMTNRLRVRNDDPIAMAAERVNRWNSVSRNSTLNFGLFGICLGTCLGLAGGLSAGWTARKLVVSIVRGAAIGGISGVLGGLLAAVVSYSLRDAFHIDTSLRAAMIHSTGWLIPGLACGIILGMSLGGRKLALLAVGGLLGGLFSALLYEPLSGILFQLERTDIPLPEGSWNKLMFLFLAAESMVMGAWIADAVPVKRVASSPT